MTNALIVGPGLAELAMTQVKTLRKIELIGCLLLDVLCKVIFGF
jgi:hypothetical protein